MTIRKMLVVDDEPDDFRYLCAAFSDWHMLFAINAFMAQEKAVIEQPDIILIDYVMPGTDTVDLCRTLRRLTSGVLIAHTVHPSGSLLLEEAGCTTSVLKPARPQVLRDVIAQCSSQLIETSGTGQFAKVERRLTPDELARAILRIVGHTRRTPSEISNLLNIPLRTIQRHLQRLVKQRMLATEGVTRSRHYYRPELEEESHD